TISIASTAKEKVIKKTNVRKRKELSAITAADLDTRRTNVGTRRRSRLNLRNNSKRNSPRRAVALKQVEKKGHFNTQSSLQEALRQKPWLTHAQQTELSLTNN